MPRSWLLLATLALPLPGGPPAQATRAGDARAVLVTWFRHIERDQFDALRALLTPDFVFVSDGARMGPDTFIAMIKGLGITHPRVRLSNVDAHQTDRLAYLVYDRTESFSARGVTKTVPETGTMVLVRRGSRWLIAQWTTTSPPR